MSGRRGRSTSLLAALLRDPGVASVARSSRFLAERVARCLPPGARRVIELGAGDGAVTRRLLGRMPPRGRLLAVEANRELWEGLRRVPDRRLKAVRGDARQLGRLASRARLGPADAVVSGVPMSLFGRTERLRLLHAVRLTLRPGGRFVAYQTTPMLAPLLEASFKSVRVRFELRNLPPLFILSAVK